MARSRKSLGRLLSESLFPVYVLDDQRSIVYANDALLEWTCTPKDELIGTRCDYHSNPEVGVIREVAARLCPPPEALRGQRTRGEVSCRLPSGELSRRYADFIPLGPDELELVGVLAVVDGADAADANRSISPATQLHKELWMLREHVLPRYGIDRLVGDSPAIRRVRQQVRFAHDSFANTVIFGPPGSGRENVARTIHYGDNPRSAGRLVPIACALMDAELLQAAIGNVARQPGHVHPSRPATFLLLDVDQLPETAQYELAGFFNVAGIALHTLSTARSDLVELAAKGEFRSDLAAVLSTLVVRLPALAERPGDIPALAQVFLERFNAAGGRQLSGFSNETLDQLAQYPWPGNVDELAEIIHEACAHAEDTVIRSVDLPSCMRLAADAAAYPRLPEETIVLDEFLAEIESELIQRAMRRVKGNKTKASQLLGVTRARLHRRLEQSVWHSETVGDDQAE